MTQTIPVFRPFLDEPVQEAARASLERGWLGMGRDVAAFEKGVAKLLGADDRHVVAVSTGHAALHLALLRCGVGPGDEVITPSFNNIADLQAILATGAQPVFCDVEDVTLCIDVGKAAELITPRTKALLPVDYAASLCRHDDALALAREHGLRVLRDAAHSFGSRESDGRMVGARGDLCMFSFDPVKNITCIDGGAIVTPNEDDVAALHAMRLIGMGQPAETMYRNERAWTYDVRRIGWRYHLANLHGAIGVAQLERMDEIAQSRRDVFNEYHKAMRGLDWLRLPAPIDGHRVPFIFVVRVAAEMREPFRKHLKEWGVETGVHWQPGHGFSLFAPCRRGELAVTEQAGREIVTLPMHPMMDHRAVERIIEAVRRFEPGAQSNIESIASSTASAGQGSASDVVARRIEAMKFAGSDGAMPRLAIDGPRGVVAWLRSLPHVDEALAERDAELLTEWRQREMRWFSSRFTPTVERTRLWLIHNVRDQPDRILYMIETEHGEPIGHIGLTDINIAQRTAELDNMIRGAPGVIPGVMALAERSLARWTFDELGMDRITGRVLSNNSRTLAHHGRIGFRIVGHTALERIVDEQGDRYEERPDRPIDDDELTLAHIELRSDDRLAWPHELAPASPAAASQAHRNGRADAASAVRMPVGGAS